MLCLSIWGADAWDSSGPPGCVISLPRLRRVPRGTRWPWQTVKAAVLDPPPSRDPDRGSMRKARLVMSAQHPTASSHESLSGFFGFSSGPSLYSRHTHASRLPSHTPDPRRPEFSCICLDSCQTCLNSQSRWVHASVWLPLCAWDLYRCRVRFASSSPRSQLLIFELEVQVVTRMHFLKMLRWKYCVW